MLGYYWTNVRNSYGAIHTVPSYDTITHKLSNRCECDPEMIAMYDEEDENVVWQIVHQMLGEEDE